MIEKQSNNPIPVVDVIIQQDSEVLFAKRKKEPFKGYLGLPGGFVNIRETIEEAARREVKEETSLDIELTDILGVYSDPQRDPRGHIMSAFDHKIILSNYKKWKEYGGTFWSTKK
jgi:8-oxo-dGTP diphosphatase